MALSKDWKRAFFAAIGGCCADPNVSGDGASRTVVNFAVFVANEAEAKIADLEAEELEHRAATAEANIAKLKREQGPQ